MSYQNLLSGASHYFTTINHITRILVIIGAVNWGSIGLFEIDLVKLLFPESNLVRIVYIAVGMAAVLQFYSWLRVLNIAKQDT